MIDLDALASAIKHIDQRIDSKADWLIVLAAARELLEEVEV